MVNEIIGIFEFITEGFLVDATLGLGGHAAALLRSNPSISLLGIDSDSQAIDIARERLEEFDERSILKHGNYVNMQAIAKKGEVNPVFGVLLDLGLSSFQLASEQRGFSFNGNNKLDMRINLKQKLTADKIVNSYSVKEISDLLKKYGEEKNHFKIASEIVRYRSKKKISTCEDLSEIINKINKNKSNINPSTRTFQALRIAVNKELDAIEEFLEKSEKILNIGARLVIITFHSLEDRIVKRFFKSSESKCICPPTQLICDCKKKQTFKVINKKPIRPTEQEILLNPSSRSAKMRIGEAI